MNVSTAAKRYNARLPIYQTYRAYSRGEHELRFMDRDFMKESGNEMKGMRENMCGAVIDAFVDQLSVTSWGSAANDKVAEDLGLDRVLNVVNAEAFRCGQSFAIVSNVPSRGLKIVITQRADQVLVEVDDIFQDRLKKATRLWIDSDNYPRQTVIDSLRTNEWIASEPLRTNEKGALENTQFPTAEQSWLLVDSFLHGFNVVPVVQWKQGSDSAYDDGVSILSDVIPLQDALNQSLINTIVLGDSYARPFWYLLNYQPSNPSNPFAAAQELAQVLGQALDDNAIGNLPEGDPAGRFNRKKQKIFTHDGAGPFGQLDPPDIEKMLNVQDRFALKIARVVGMPSYYITQTSGDVPSGASLRVLTTRMTSRVRNFQLDSNPVLKGLGELLGMTAPQPDWADPAPMDETEKVAIAAQKKALGYELEDAISGLDEPDAAGIVARAAAKAEQARQDAQRGMMSL